MSVVGVVAPKGGVGKSTISANMATALARSYPALHVCAVDLDPQNGLESWFRKAGLGRSDLIHQQQKLIGICEATLTDRQWLDVAQRSNQGVTWLPYGSPTLEQQRQFTKRLERNSLFVADQIDDLGVSSETIAVINSISGDRESIEQLAATADVLICVIRLDPSCYATIHGIEESFQEIRALRSDLEMYYLCNGIDQDDSLQQAILMKLRRHFRHRLIPVLIQNDVQLTRASAFGEPIQSFDAHGQGSFDMSRLASWLVNTLADRKQPA